MRVYAYRIDRFKIRTLLDQHSHDMLVPVGARFHQRCRKILPSQPASVRGSGAAATQATVHAL
jgi:hypothetical protein